MAVIPMLMDLTGLNPLRFTAFLLWPLALRAGVSELS